MKSILSNFLTFSVILILAITACQTPERATQSEPAEPPAAENPFASIFDTSKVFSGNLTGFALYDPEADSMIYAQNEDRYFTPASNTKLFTFYTGLKLLPDSLRALDYVERGDSLIFWGTGDPSFLHEEFGNGTVYEFLKDSDRELYFSDANFDDELRGPGWSWSDHQYYYQTEKTPLPMYGNTATFEIESIELQQIARTEEGALAVEPKNFRSFIKESNQRDEDDPVLSRELDGNNFNYKPEADTITYTTDKPYHYTPQLITEMLSDTLGKSVTYLPDIEKPDTTKALYSIASETAYKKMLQPSDNFIAEQLLFVTASELGMSLNSEAVIDTIVSAHLEVLPDEPQWVDGSGLSRYNMFTPRSIIQLLRSIDDEFISDQELFDLLPAGGESGTISSWYPARDGGPPYVFAKTGTLSNNHSLSGFVITQNGKKLLFTFQNNHYVGSSSIVKEEMEKVLWYIHTTY